MPNPHVATLLCLSVLGLAACGENRPVAANSKICFDFKAAKTAAPIAGDDGAAAVEDCVRRWAYSLAPSRDAAETVAGAVVEACSVQLTRWNRQALSQPNDGGGDSASIITGEPTTPIGEHNAFTRSRALFYVVQARAGACAPPPAANGVPTGVS